METYEVKVYPDGSRHWYQNGQCHRLDGPACEYANGGKEWYQNDLCHRLDGPAYEYANGDKLWYQNGLYHRLDGPAVEWANGSKFWYIKGKELSEAEFLQRTDPTECTNKTIEIDGKKYRLQKTS